MLLDRRVRHTARIGNRRVSLITPKGEAASPNRTRLSGEVHSSTAATTKGGSVTRSIARRALALALLTLASAFVAMSVSAPSAHAALGVACPDPVTQAFLQWNDPAKYAFLPNGGFEQGTYGWTVSGGAKVVSGNESFFVHSRYDRYSLSLPPGSSATSPPMCLSLLNSKMRFFTQNTGNPAARMRVQVLYNGGVGGLLSIVTKLLGVSDVAAITAAPTWQPSSPVGMLSGTLPLLTNTVQFRFTPLDSGGAWQIDDVYLDPVLNV
jgi:hypothetical protein